MDLQTQTGSGLPWARELDMGSAESGFVVKPTFCQMPRTLAWWLKGGSGQLRCDCEIKSLNTQAAVSTAEDAPVFSKWRERRGWVGKQWDALKRAAASSSLPSQ